MTALRSLGDDEADAALLRCRCRLLTGVGRIAVDQLDGFARHLLHPLRQRAELPPLALYAWYVRRGEPELWIKNLKDACFADWLSCHRFWANQFRLLPHAAAYWLLNTLRQLLIQAGLAGLQLDTLRLRLIKIADWVRARTHTHSFHLASSHPGEQLPERLAGMTARFNLRE